MLTLLSVCAVASAQNQPLLTQPNQNPQAAPSGAIAPTNESAEERCTRRFRNDADNRLFCANYQNTSERKLRNYFGAIPTLCRGRWGEDHLNTLGCAEAQEEGRLYILRRSDDPTLKPVIESCENRNPGDHELAGYCVRLVVEARAAQPEQQETGETGTTAETTGTSSLFPGSANFPTPRRSSIFVLRHVNKLEGPYRLLPFKPSAPRLIQLEGENETKSVRLSDLEVSLPSRYRALIVARLGGKQVYIEQPSGQSKRAYLYIEARRGEWTAKYPERLEQINLSLIKAGAAVPSETLSEEYAHFYRSALSRARLDRVGMWAGR